jgi:hypothetical protein
MAAKIEHLLDDFEFSTISAVYPGREDWLAGAPPAAQEAERQESSVPAGD